MLCLQKWLPNNLPAFSIFSHKTADITDFPIPAFPLITITRFEHSLSPNQLSTSAKIDKRVPFKYLFAWCLTSCKVSTFASLLRISSSHCFFLSPFKSSIFCWNSFFKVFNLSYTSSTFNCVSWIVLLSSSWVRRASSSFALLSWRVRWSSSWVWRMYSNLELFFCTASWSCSWVFCTSLTILYTLVWTRRISFSCDFISSSESAHSSNASKNSCSPQRSAFNLSISACCKPRATRTALISCHRVEKVGSAIPVVVTWPYNSLR